MSESTFRNLIYDRDGAVAILRLNRPAKKNSLNFQLRQELIVVLREIERDHSVKSVILTGGEEIFCAGADINEFQETTSPESSYQHSRDFQSLCNQVECLPQPVIAAVAGYALGGGCELTLACDFRMASEGAQLGLPEIKIALFPAGGGTQRLPRLIGAAKAKELILTGNSISAEQALSIGLVMKVVPKYQLLDEAKRFAYHLASLPRLAMEASKRLINQGIEMDLQAALELEARCLGNLASTHDFREGPLAFLEKRKPDFTD